MLENKAINFRDDFPGYMGYIPFKKEVIGMTVGSTNNYIRGAYTIEPPKEESLRAVAYDDYTHYNKDYFNDNFSRDYKLEDNQIYSNKSRDASTWINGSKYKIYPQHIPGYKAHVPGVYSSNIHGMGYSKSTAIAVKGDYTKTADVTNKERYISSNNVNYKKPQMRSQEGTENINSFISVLNNQNAPKFIDPSSLKKETKVIYKSKIANVPTPGYSGHTSIFTKQISYLNKEKIEKEQVNEVNEEKDNLYNEISDSFKSLLNLDAQETGDLPYIVGYRGYRSGIKAKNFYGSNFRETSLTSRRK